MSTTTPIRAPKPVALSAPAAELPPIVALIAFLLALASIADVIVLGWLTAVLHAMWLIGSLLILRLVLDKAFAPVFALSRFGRVRRRPTP